MKMQSNAVPSHIPTAHYVTNQRIPRYRGNKLVEALPVSWSESELIQSLTLEPDFQPEARTWEPQERLHELRGLANFMFPLASHIQLSRVIDSMMREGYVGRRPLSRDHVAIYHDIHKLEQQRRPFRQTADSVTPDHSAALIGVSGMGKTTTVRRCLAHIPPVIYHPELDLYQVTHLHFEMPTDGSSVKALATSIIERLDALIPNSRYFEKYVDRGRTAGHTLIHVAARLMNTHCVGLLIPDEVQNLGNAHKDDQVLMSELVSMCNTIKVPQLYIGTYKADKIFGLDLRGGRRALDNGLGDWNPLPRWEVRRGRDGELVNSPGEWVEFITELWRYQWVQRPVPLTENILDKLYEYTQGIIDLAIKLFAVSQARAILDQSEQLSEELLLDVYRREMRLIHPMIEAMRSGDTEALKRFGDIKPLKMGDMMSELGRRHRGQRSRAASVRPGSDDFELRLASAAEAIGMSSEDAAAVARDINDDGTAKNMFDAVEQLSKKMAPPKPVSKTKKAKAKEASEPAVPDLADRPEDYRNAVVLAFRQKTTVMEQLVKLGMAPEPEELVCLG